MDSQKGFSKIAIILVVLVVIGVLAGGYFLFLRGEKPAISLPTFTKSSSEELQGFWRAEKLLQFDPTSKEFKEDLTQTKQAKDVYIEFRGEILCLFGKLDPEGKPVFCPGYFPFTIKGNTFSVERAGDETDTPVFQWEIKAGKLELVFSPQDGGQKIKLILAKMSESQVGTEVFTMGILPSQLKGQWKIVQLFEFNPVTSEFFELSLKGRSEENAYIEFGEDNICLLGKLDEKGQPLYCTLSSSLFGVEANAINFPVKTMPRWTWDIKEGKVELTINPPAGDSSTHVTRYILEKLP